MVLGHRAAEIRKAVPLGGAEVLNNPDYAEGMASSLRLGVRAAAPRAKHLMVVLADQPFVSPATLEHLMHRAEQGDGSIFIPTYKGVWGNPVVFDADLAPEAERIQGDIGCRAMFPDHSGEIREVPVDDPGILVDIDTEAELGALESALASGAPLRDVLRPDRGSAVVTARLAVGASRPETASSGPGLADPRPGAEVPGGSIRPRHRRPRSPPDLGPPRLPGNHSGGWVARRVGSGAPARNTS